MAKGVIFDCFGVLYGTSFDRIKAMAPHGRVDEVADLHNQVDYGFIDQTDYIAGVAELLDMTYEEVAAIIRQEHVQNADLIDYIRKLRNSHKVALLSNVGRGGFDGVFTDAELEELFDVVVLSFEEGIIKPHPHIFQVTALRMGLQPGECMMVDDIESNVEGARAAGLTAQLHTNNQLTTQRIETWLAEEL